jgi:hypothetical protein
MKGDNKMKTIKSISFNDEPIHVFESLMYIFDLSDEYGPGYGLHLELITTELTIRKYRYQENILVDLTYTNGELQTLVMLVDHTEEGGHGEIPEMSLYVSIRNPKEFPELAIVNWDTEQDVYPELQKNISLTEIRAVEMPYENVRLDAELPMDLSEWTHENRDNISEIITEALYDYWKKKASE